MNKCKGRKSGGDSGGGDYGLEIKVVNENGSRRGRSRAR